MTDTTAVTRPAPKSLDDVFSYILSDAGLTEEDVARLPRQELVQDLKGRMWKVGDETPIVHPKIPQRAAILFEEGPEVRVYSIPSAPGAPAIGFALWKFRTDQPGFRFAFVPMETWQTLVGREFERQLDELEGEENEYDAAVAYMRSLHPGTSLPNVLIALAAGKHLPEDDEEEDEEPEAVSGPNGVAAEAAATTPTPA